LQLTTTQGYAIEADNNVVMNAAPALLLAKEPPPHYADELATYIIDEKYQPFLNKVGKQFII